MKNRTEDLDPNDGEWGIAPEDDKSWRWLVLWMGLALVVGVAREILFPIIPAPTPPVVVGEGPEEVIGGNCTVGQTYAQLDANPKNSIMWICTKTSKGEIFRPWPTPPNSKACLNGMQTTGTMVDNYARTTDWACVDGEWELRRIR